MRAVIIPFFMAAGILMNLEAAWEAEPMVVWFVLPLCILALIGLVWRVYRQYAAEQGMMDMRKNR